MAWLSYILILHQTTTCGISRCRMSRCLISLFYIKPQQKTIIIILSVVVLYPYSTSNHNCWYLYRYVARVVLYPYSTSNHNNISIMSKKTIVVLYPYSTSNHNLCHTLYTCISVVLYPYSTSNHNMHISHICAMVLSYILILHQTTTRFPRV